LIKNYARDGSIDETPLSGELNSLIHKLIHCIWGKLVVDKR